MELIEVAELKERKVLQSAVLDFMQEMDHEQVVFCFDEVTGLKAIIAIHNTTLGPSLGGTRMWNYENENDAIYDVLRLSRGMTYKAAISGLNLGGGKAIIIGDSRTGKSEALFRRFGKFVDSLGGKYITAEDVGVGTKDMEYVSMETNFVAGLPEYMSGGGDPSPVTAYGVYMGMKAAMKHHSGNDSLSNKTIAVQGVGSVGSHLIEHLSKEGANIVVTDIHAESLQRIASKYNVKVVNSSKIYDVYCDVYAPCALGATINDETINRLNCSVVAGGANNQLANEAEHGRILMEKGITYAPDFLINAGGIINCDSEISRSGYNKVVAMKNTEEIYYTTLKILTRSKAENISSHEAAMKLAEERIAKMKAIKG